MNDFISLMILAIDWYIDSVVIFITRIFEKSSDGGDDDDSKQDNDDDDNGETCTFYYAPIFLSAVAEAVGVGMTSLVINR